MAGRMERLGAKGNPLHDGEISVSEPAVLISHQALMRTRPIFEAQGIRTYALWEGLPEDRADIRVIAHIGDQKLPRDLLDSLPDLGLIACPNAGYDGIDMEWCDAHHVAVTHAQGVNAIDVADHAIGVMITGWRKIFEGDRSVRSGAWRTDRPAETHRRFSRRKIGIVGLGAIGHAVAQRLGPFEAQISWFGPSQKNVPWIRFQDLVELASWSDILLVSCRADLDNQRLISAEVIDALGTEGYLVNVSRGSVVDEEALIAALCEGRLGGASLDVFQEEPTPSSRWADVPNVILTPHMAATTQEAVGDMRAQMIENVRRFLDDEPLLSRVVTPSSAAA